MVCHEWCVYRMMCVSNHVCVESCVRRIMCVSNDVCVESCVCRVMCVSNDVCVEWCVCLAPRQVFALHIAKSTALCNQHLYICVLVTWITLYEALALCKCVTLCKAHALCIWVNLCKVLALHVYTTHDLCIPVSSFFIFHLSTVNPEWIKDLINRITTNNEFVLLDFLKIAEWW